MRLPYASKNAEDYTGEDAAIFQRIAARRAPRPPIPLDLALLHSTPVADGWNTFLGKIRTGTTLDAGLRELAISRVAVLNKATYEWTSHAPLALKGGISAETLEAVRTLGLVGKGAKVKEEGEGELSGKQWAVLAYTDHMTKEVEVEEAVFENLKKHFSDKEVVEFTATIAAYNCVSRFLVALDVGECNGKPIESVS